MHKYKKIKKEERAKINTYMLFQKLDKNSGTKKQNCKGKNKISKITV